MAVVQCSFGIPLISPSPRPTQVFQIAHSAKKERKKNRQLNLILKRCISKDTKMVQKRSAKALASQALFFSGMNIRIDDFEEKNVPEFYFGATVMYSL